jgi:hypothetical protein
MSVAASAAELSQMAIALSQRSSFELRAFGFASDSCQTCGASRNEVPLADWSAKRDESREALL